MAAASAATDHSARFPAGDSAGSSENQNVVRPVTFAFGYNVVRFLGIYLR